MSENGVQSLSENEHRPWESLCVKITSDFGIHIQANYDLVPKDVCEESNNGSILLESSA